MSSLGGLGGGVAERDGGSGEFLELHGVGGSAGAEAERVPVAFLLASAGLACFQAFRMVRLRWSRSGRSGGDLRGGS
ncbi:hypothetical protein [Roseomonas chloroacetimidivorans]|uniref:hypothetical protein n=1 Tax=Roseomonas chloroacetimidivorans TaxID=1766656 RepID=UPI003C73F848